MAEFKEGVKPKAHDTPERECPFCPGKETDTWTTFPGEKNHSGHLADIMQDPPVMAQKQSNSRPKDGKKGRQKSTKRKKPNPIYKSKTYGAYSCEAHHAISGNQIMDGHAIEKFIVANGTVKKDTGYSINNSENGVWLPSIPERLKQGKWGGLRLARKRKIAEEPMAAGKGQFHKGPHNVKDKEDPTEKYHRSYPKVGKQKLREVVDYILLWPEECFLCTGADPKKGKFPPPYKVNQYLDDISEELTDHMLSDASAWRFFISKVAMLYHKDNCSCGLHLGGH